MIVNLPTLMVFDNHIAAYEFEDRLRAILPDAAIFEIGAKGGGISLVFDENNPPEKSKVKEMLSLELGQRSPIITEFADTYEQYIL